MRWALPRASASGGGAEASFSLPSIGQLRATSASALEWEHTFTPHELNFLRCHRVGKVPLLPGTCYIEFVRVVVVAVHGLQLYSLDKVNFKSIMFLDDDAQLFGSTLVRLQLDRHTGSVGISSTRDNSAWTQHAEMELQLRGESTSPESLAVADTQALCPEHVNDTTYYAATGNDYRGEFHAMAEGWGGGDTVLSRVAYESKETKHLHLRACAFLDACSHALLWWYDHRRRPFYAASVKSYHVNSADISANQETWSVTDAAYRMFSSTGSCMIHAEGWDSATFEVGWLEERRSRRHTYQVQWEKAALSSSKPMTLLTVGLLDNCIHQRPTAAPSPPSAPVLIVALSSGVDSLPMLASALGLVQSCVPKAPANGVWMLSFGASTPSTSELVDAQHSGTVGLSRSARTEAAAPIHCADMGAHKACSALERAGALCTITEPEVALRGEMMRSPRLTTAKPASHEPKSADKPSTQLITGGTGGIGLLTAGWLAEAGKRAQVVLVSRSGVLPLADAERLRSSAAGVIVERCDAAQSTETYRMMAMMQGLLQPLRGVWHTAGVLADALLATRRKQAAARVWGQGRWRTEPVQHSHYLAPGVLRPLLVSCWPGWRRRAS
jgi:hypothetical protein